MRIRFSSFAFRLCYNQRVEKIFSVFSLGCFFAPPVCTEHKSFLADIEVANDLIEVFPATSLLCYLSAFPFFLLGEC